MRRVRSVTPKKKSGATSANGKILASLKSAIAAAERRTMDPGFLEAWRKSLLAEMDRKDKSLARRRAVESVYARRKTAHQIKTVAEFIRLTTAATTNADMAAVEQDWNRWCKRTERNA
jgi:DNA invertase Pin-like site-specific DNA recombinase